MKNLKNKKGFTIVELVIVIAVIAILAAVLIPTFSNVVGNAKEVAVQSDAKAIYTEYVSTVAATGEVLEEIYVKLGDNEYIKVVNGVAVDADSDGSYTDEIVTACPSGYSWTDGGAATPVA